jgi:hypothetical protein
MVTNKMKKFARNSQPSRPRTTSSFANISLANFFKNNFLSNKKTRDFACSTPQKEEKFSLRLTPRNRSGAEEIMSMYWLAILFIAAGGIIGMVFIFYGNPYDIRDIEANLLVDKLADCISYGGKINNLIISDGKTGEFIFSNCHLNFGSEEDEYFYKVSIYKVEDLANPFLDYFFQTHGGNLNLEASYSINEYSENLPVGVERSFYSLDNVGNQYIIKILGVIKKTKQNV